MECLQIDWNTVDGSFVRDEFYESIQAPKWIDFTTPERVVDDRQWFCEDIGCIPEEQPFCQAPNSIVITKSEPQNTSESLTPLQIQNAVAVAMAPLPESAVSAATSKRARGIVSSSLSSLSDVKAGNSEKSKHRAHMPPIAERKGQVPKKSLQQASENANPNQASKAQAGIEKAPSSKVQEGVAKKLGKSEQKDTSREPKVIAPAKEVPSRAFKDALGLSEQAKYRDDGSSKGSNQITTAGKRVVKSVVSRNADTKHFSDVSNLCSEGKKSEGTRSVHPSKVALKNSTSLAVSTKRVGVPRSLHKSCSKNEKSAQPKTPRIEQTKVELLPDVVVKNSNCNLSRCEVDGCEESKSGVELLLLEVRDPESQAHALIGKQEDSCSQTQMKDAGEKHNGIMSTTMLDPQPQELLRELRQAEEAHTQSEVHPSEGKQDQLHTSTEHDPQSQTLLTDDGINLNEQDSVYQKRCPVAGEDDFLIRQTLNRELLQQEDKQSPVGQDEAMVEETLDCFLRSLCLTTPVDKHGSVILSDGLQDLVSEQAMVHRSSSQSVTRLQPRKPVSSQEGGSRAMSPTLQGSIAVSLQTTAGESTLDITKDCGRKTKQKQQISQLRKDRPSQGKKRKSSELNFKVNCSTSKDLRHEVQKERTSRPPVRSSLCQKSKLASASLSATLWSQIYSDSCKDELKKLRTSTMQPFKPFRLRTEERGALKELGICSKKDFRLIIPQEIVHHALRMPSFGHPFIPQRSTKKLTIPKEPKFHPTRARKTCSKHVIVPESDL